MRMMGTLGKTSLGKSSVSKATKMLGVVGGLGPEATIEYYRLLVNGYRERAGGASPPLLIHSIDVDRVLGLAAEGKREELAEYLLESVHVLAQAGADFALMSANTPHIVFDAVARQSPVLLLSIVEATCEFAVQRKLSNLGLLGTRFTMQSGIYQDVCTRQGIRVTLPKPEEQNFIHEKYVGEMVKGKFLPETRAGFLAIAERMRIRDAIDGLILGGTEMPLLLNDNGGIGIPFLDTTRIHVDAALERMLS
jgi:aspartate racemase